MRRPAATDFLSAALSVVLWYSGFLLVMTGFHVTRASESGLLPSVTDCGIYFLVAFVMHLLFARRIATVRGWRFWLMPIVTVPLVILLILVLQWTPKVLSSLKFCIEAASLSPDMLTFGTAQLGSSVRVFGHTLLIGLQMAPDITFLMYPLLMAHQFLIRVLYRSQAADCPAQAQA